MLLFNKTIVLFSSRLGTIWNYLWLKSIKRAHISRMSEFDEKMWWRNIIRIVPAILLGCVSLFSMLWVVCDVYNTHSVWVSMNKRLLTIISVVCELDGRIFGFSVGVRWNRSLAALLCGKNETPTASVTPNILKCLWFDSLANGKQRSLLLWERLWLLWKAAVT